MDRETAVAKLSLIEGVWQESPDCLSVSEDAGRGSLYLLTGIEGPAEGRASLARELIETARREYVASHGSITLALSQAVRAANTFFYDVNLNTAREERHLVGLTAAVIRDNELFLAQGGPGLTCRVAGSLFERWPNESPWFEPDAIVDDYPTNGAVPLGIRRDYTPDLFHISLNPGDVFIFATRHLAHLFHDAELVDAAAHLHPDQIVDNLEDVAGASDLSALVVRLPGDVPDEPARLESEVGAELLAEMEKETLVVPPRPNEPAATESRPPKSPAARPVVGATPHPSRLGALSEQIGNRWAGVAPAMDRAASRTLRALLSALGFSVRAFLPEEPQGARTPAPPPAWHNLWKIAALVFPVVLIVGGLAGWVIQRAERQRVEGTQIGQWIDQANAAMDQGNKLAKTDKAGARDTLQKALSLTQQALKLNPNHAAARNAFYQAQDLLDAVNGISVLLLTPRIATFPDPQSKPSRIVSHWPDVYVLDRGTARVYRYAVNDAGTGATPQPGTVDGIILKAGDKVGERVVSDLMDILWLETGRLIALDRGGAFLTYEPNKSAWTARPANDASFWAKANVAFGYLGNLYLLDPSRNQIMKYAPGGDGTWTSAVTYLPPEVKVDLTNAVDMAIDGDVWVLRADGTVWRFAAGRLANFTPSEMDTPLANSTSLFTSPSLVGVYVADAGNQRLAQFDKVTGKLVRQFRPRGLEREAFSALKAITVDETNRKFFFINGNQAFWANIPQ